MYDVSRYFGVPSTYIFLNNMWFPPGDVCYKKAGFSGFRQVAKHDEIHWFGTVLQRQNFVHKHRSAWEEFLGSQNVSPPISSDCTAVFGLSSISLSYVKLHFRFFQSLRRVVQILFCFQTLGTNLEPTKTIKSIQSIEIPANYIRSGSLT